MGSVTELLPRQCDTIAKEVVTSLKTTKASKLMRKMRPKTAKKGFLSSSEPLAVCGRKNQKGLPHKTYRGAHGNALEKVNAWGEFLRCCFLCHTLHLVL